MTTLQDFADWLRARRERVTLSQITEYLDAALAHSTPEPGPTCACHPKHNAGEYGPECQKANSFGIGYCFEHPGLACWGPEWDDVVAAIPLDALPPTPEPSLQDALAAALHDTDPTHQNPAKGGGGAIDDCPDRPEYEGWTDAIIAALPGLSLSAQPKENHDDRS